jgi:hypothetical protein
MFLSRNIGAKQANQGTLKQEEKNNYFHQSLTLFGEKLKRLWRFTLKVPP